MDPTAAGSQQRLHDALRVQVAAVAAQQAALTEEETRLDQRRVALERQEEQLAVRLEEQRNQLLELQANVRAERAALRKEHGGFECFVTESFSELERGRHTLTADHEMLRARRKRFLALCRRSRERRVAASAELEKQRRVLESRAKGLEQEKTALTAARLHHNTEIELGRRQLQERWDELAQAIKHWREQQVREQAASRRIEVRAAALAAAERSLADERREWDTTRRDRELELEGLENRIRHQRSRLTEFQQAAAPGGPIGKAEDLAETAPPASVHAEAPDQQTAQAADLERLLAELADQRLCLAEQLERFLLLQQQEKSEHAEAVAELEPKARQLQEHEAALLKREQALGPRERELDLRERALAGRAQRLEGMQARFTVEQSAWQGERDAFLARLNAREQHLERRSRALNGLRQRWTERRRQDGDHLQSERTWCEALRRECALLREEWFRRGEMLEQDRRALAEQALALEQYRLECVAQAEDSVAAEKRIAGLRRSWASLHAAAERTLTRERRALGAETTRVEERSRRLELRAAEMSRLETELADRQTRWEQECAEAEAANAELRREVQTLRAIGALHGQQLHKLHAEVERMARLLMEEGEGLSETQSRAA